MHRLLSMAISLLAILAFTGAAGAAQITPASITGYGTFNNSASLIINNTIPAEGTWWTDPPCVWWENTGAYFNIDLGQTYTVQDMLIQVDCNDTYVIRHSLNGASWTTLATILESYGEIFPGMDTMTTSAGAEYVSQIDFSAVTARYIQLQGAAGDVKYSISEAQFFGSPVPVPGAAGLLALGLAGLAAYGRKRR